MRSVDAAPRRSVCNRCAAAGPTARELHRGVEPDGVGKIGVGEIEGDRVDGDLEGDDQALEVDAALVELPIPTRVLLTATDDERVRTRLCGSFLKAATTAALELPTHGGCVVGGWPVALPDPLTRPQGAEGIQGIRGDGLRPPPVKQPVAPRPALVHVSGIPRLPRGLLQGSRSPAAGYGWTWAWAPHGPVSESTGILPAAHAKV